MSPSNYGSATNYLVPAGGQTHYVAFSQVFTATPETFDWRQFAIDNFPFQPQGAFIDNTAGTASLIINIQPINFNVVVPAGVGAQVQFPAPNGQSMSITGLGQATVVFVDFPVLPDAGLVDIGNTVSINIAAIAGGVTIPTTPAVNAAGLPYQVQQQPANTTQEYLSISGALVTASVAPPANTNLRKLLLSITGDATLAAAGHELITITLNAVQVFQENVYIPAVVGSLGTLYQREISYDGCAANVGATGTLVVTIGTALATGILDLNANFA